MKLEDIRRFVFVNPSPNMLLLSKHVKDFGLYTQYVFTEDYFNNNSKKLHYFFETKSISYENTTFQSSNIDSKIYLFKKSFLNNIRFKSYKSEFHNLSNDFQEGNFVDLQMLKSQNIEIIPKISVDKVNSFKEILRNYYNYNIVCSYLPSDMYSENTETEQVVIYKTDMDVRCCFGDDYFIIFIDNYRVELFCIDGLLHIVTPKNIHPIELMMNKFSFMKKFSFEKQKELLIIRNRFPWIMKSEEIILLNDYSFFNTSVKMPNEWYENLGKHLCTGKP